MTRDNTGYPSSYRNKHASVIGIDILKVSRVS